MLNVIDKVAGEQIALCEVNYYNINTVLYTATAILNKERKKNPNSQYMCIQSS